jgi:hypothetical protein
MNDMQLLVLIASFASVFFMGINSKVIRDNYVLLGAILSWFITVANYAMMWAVLEAELSPVEYILIAGLGGSIGITLAQYAYNYTGLSRGRRK